MNRERTVKSSAVPSVTQESVTVKSAPNGGDLLERLVSQTLDTVYHSIAIGRLIP